MAQGESFDLVVIGAGPGGYVAAIRAAQLGMKVACVEKEAELGGTCLRVGCIPSKALLESSEVYEHARYAMAAHGVKVGGVELDLGAMMKRKDKVVGELTRGVAGLFKKNKVTHVTGHGRLVSPTEVAVDNGKGESRRLQARHVLIATGSAPAALPMAPFDGKQVISSTEALSLASVPGHMIVIGGGVIGLELGSVWRRLGARVSVVEMLPHLLGGIDLEVARQAQRILGRQGMEIHTGAKVNGVKTARSGVTVTAEAGNGEPLELKGDVVLVAVGRRPYTDDLGLDDVGVATDERGRIKVDERGRTDVASVYAIGDVIEGPMLAHKASEEGVAVAERLAGQSGHVNYEAIPWVIYTWPEIAWVGRGEDELKAAGVDYRVGKYPFTANPRAKTMAETDGLVKILADARTDRLLGILVVGPRASEMIAEAAVAFEFHASAEDLARSVHAHPTLAEALHEAALGVDKRAIHM